MLPLKKILAWAVVLLNLVTCSFAIFFLLTGDTYDLAERLFYLLFIVTPILTLYLHLFVSRSNEWQLERQVRLARLQKELHDLSSPSA